MPKTNSATASVSTNTKQTVPSHAHDRGRVEESRAGTGAAAKALLAQWEATGQEQLQSVSSDHTRAATTTSFEASQPPPSSPHQYRAALPQDLSLAAAVASFLATLKGQSQQTHKSYRVGCRRFMWFCWATGLGDPCVVTVTSMSPFVLEDFYLWLVEWYGREARTTMAGYLAATRNLFEYLARRQVTAQGCQYQEMVAGLSRLQGRASYRTPRVRGKQVAQVVRLVVAKAADDASPSSKTETMTLTENKSTTNNENGDNLSEQVMQSADEEVVVAKVDQEESDSLKTAPQKSWAAKSDKEKARQHLEEVRDRAIILTLYTSGMRRQEVVALNRADLEPLIVEAGLQSGLSPKYEETTAPEEESVWELLITGKGQKERIAYFDRATLKGVAEYLALRGKDSYRPLFIQHHRNRDLVKPGPQGNNYRLGLAGVWSVVRKYGKLLGVDLKPHDFRHNLATTLLNAGAQLSEVQDILGHASPTTTKLIYAHYEKSHLRQAFTRYHTGSSEL